MPILSPSEPAFEPALDRGDSAPQSSKDKRHERGSQSGEYAIFWLDLNGSVTRWSDDCERLFSRVRTDGLRTRFADYFLAEDRSRGLPESILRDARERGSWDGSGWRVTADDRAFWAACSVTHVSTPNGLQIGYMVVTQDMTRLLSDGADAFLGEGAARLLSLGRVASDVSHDMRNILSAIRGFAGLLERHLPDGGMPHQAWYELLKACDRGSALTDRLLETGRTHDDEAAVADLTAVLRGIEPLLRQLLPDRIGLRVLASEHLPPVPIRASEIELVLLNLVVNARDAIGTEGSVVVLANSHGPEGAEGQYISLVVRDDGCGMTPPVLERAVERAYTTKAPGAGSGLGLALVRETIGKSGGSMTIDSTAGSGTAVTLRLPSARLISGAVLPLRRSVRTARAVICCRSPVLKDCVFELLRREGFDVERVCCDVDGVTPTLDGSEDLVLLEEGCCVWDELAACPATEGPRPRTICFTGASAETDGPEAGSVDTTLEWPFAPEELLLEVRSLLERPEQRAVN